MTTFSYHAESNSFEYHILVLETNLQNTKSFAWRIRCDVRSQQKKRENAFMDYVHSRTSSYEMDMEYCQRAASPDDSGVVPTYRGSCSNSASSNSSDHGSDECEKGVAWSNLKVGYSEFPDDYAVPQYIEARPSAAR
eukprot:7916063-Pyramimonas_sp.AAC.1